MNTEQINNLINTCQQEIRRLQEKNQQLKEQLEASEKVRKDALNLIEKLRFEKWSITGSDIVSVMDILDIDKGE